MKVIFDSTAIPFFLAHGGAKTQILNTAQGLRDLGVDVEFTRWWDSEQEADLIHVFGIPNRGYLRFARKKGIPVVNTTLFTGSCNRPDWRLSLQGAMIASIRVLPDIPPTGLIRSHFPWDSYEACDMNIVGLQAETEVLKRCYGVSGEQIRKIPLGLTPPFLNTGPAGRESRFLITTGTITERKRSIELARLAKDTGVPICFVGKPYDPAESYWKQFQGMVDGDLVKHVGHTESVEELISLLQSSRGFVLYSDYENWCLSAHEADACGLPLLLPDQRWSRERFGGKAAYLTPGNLRQNRLAISAFHKAAPDLGPAGIRHHSWLEVAEMHLHAYHDVLAGRQQ
jgi:glycosyltransferase involved in cell wall biosynthesis